MRPVVLFLFEIEDLNKLMVINNLKIFLALFHSKSSNLSIHYLSVINHIPPVEGVLLNYPRMAVIDYSKSFVNKLGNNFYG